MSKTYRNEKLIAKQKALEKSQAADQFLAKKKDRGGKFWQIVEEAKKGKAVLSNFYDPNSLASTIYEAFRGERQLDNLERLFRVCEKSKLLEGGRFAIPYFGKDKNNSFIFGLKNLAHHSAHWIRRPEDFVCNSYNPLRYFSRLARHLFAKYEIPLFMDAAWFAAGGMTKTYQEWFIHLGTGQNIRTANHLPIEVTKKIAHYFMQAPNDYTISQALRFGQIIAMGGSQRLCGAINGTRLGREFNHEEFWSTVIAWFAKNAMLDTIHVGPIVDYIHNQRFVPLPDVIRNGRIVERGLGPPQPGFCMKGRTPDVLLEQVDKWHKDTAKISKNDPVEWLSCGIYGASYTEGQGANRKYYTIRELTNSEALRIEGKAMKHCVASYARSCAKGSNAIYSLKCDDERLATIEVLVAQKQIGQARGKMNFKLSPVAARIMQKWAAERGLMVSQWL